MNRPQLGSTVIGSAEPSAGRSTSPSSCADSARTRPSSVGSHSTTHSRSIVIGQAEAEVVVGVLPDQVHPTRRDNLDAFRLHGAEPTDTDATRPRPGGRDRGLSPVPMSAQTLPFITLFLRMTLRCVVRSVARLLSAFSAAAARVLGGHRLLLCHLTAPSLDQGESDRSFAPTPVSASERARVCHRRYTWDVMSRTDQRRSASND